MVAASEYRRPTIDLQRDTYTKEIFMDSPLRPAVQVTPIEEDWGQLMWLANREVGNVVDLTLGRVTIKPGQSNPRHCHPTCEEILYLLSGRLNHSLGDKNYHLTAGDTLAIAAGIFHNAVNDSGKPADMIIAYSEGERSFVLEET